MFIQHLEEEEGHHFHRIKIPEEEEEEEGHHFHRVKIPEEEEEEGHHFHCFEIA
jgi:hypothetical protein